MTPRAVQVSSHRSELGWWDMVRAAAHPRLHGYVRRYCAYVERTGEPLRRRELPSGDVELILNLGAPLQVVDPRRPGEQGGRRASFVAGPDDTYSLTETAGVQRGVQVTFTPLGAAMFFGLPMRELAGRTVELDEVLGREPEPLVSRLHDAPTWEARFDLLDAVIGARLEGAPRPAAAAEWAWRPLEETVGGVAIGELAERTGWSRRHLAARFREHVGLTPKLAGRLFRFRCAVRLLEAPSPPPLAEVACEAGYYDQAHLNRDFRTFAGLSPLRFLAARLPDGGGVAADPSA